MMLMINYSSRWWYKFITILLICALLLYLSIGIAPRAKAVVVSTVIVGTVLAAMAAAGIGLSVSGITSQELSQWVSDKLGDWTTDIGGSVEDHINNNLITVTANGVLAVGTAAAEGITNFITWLQNNDNLNDNSTISVINKPGVLQLEEMNQTYRVLSYVSSYRNWTLYMKAIAYKPDLYCVGYFDGTYYHILCAGDGDITGNGSLGVLGYSWESWDTWGGSTEFGTYNNQYNLTYGDTFSNSFPYSGDLISYTNTYNSFAEAMTAIRNTIDNGSAGPMSLEYQTTTISIPTISEKEKWYIDVGADAGEDIDTVTNGVITDTLTNTLDVSGEVAEPAQEVVIVNEEAIAVNVDHHMIGFSNLPDFAHLNLNSIWHYVSDAVDFASSWLSWFVSFFTAMPLLAIPLYMSFTLLVVLSFLRRFI